MLRRASAFMMAHVYDWAMRRSERLCLGAWRAELLASAQGRVLEIGAGTGSNLPHYPLGLELILSEPDRQMRGKLQQRLAQTGADQPQLTDWDAAAVALPDNSLDTIVSTLVLCSVKDLPRSLTELYRLLRPGGALLFLEHVVSPQANIRRWQQRIEPLWSYCCGNCHITRDTARAITAAGLQISSLTEAELVGAPAFVRRTIRGVAIKPGQTER